jgi:DNA-binding response OmpR family regulator
MDDEPHVRRLVQLALKRSGYEVVLSEHGAHAVTLFKEAFDEKNPFKLVILDLAVPGGMDGVDYLFIPTPTTEKAPMSAFSRALPSISVLGV